MATGILDGTGTEFLAVSAAYNERASRVGAIVKSEGVTHEERKKVEWEEVEVMGAKLGPSCAG